MTSGVASSGWRRFPASARLAATTLRRAAPRETLLVLVTSAASALSLLAMMLAGRELLTQLSSRIGPESLAALGPALGVLALATAIGAVATTVQAEQRMLLGYLVEHETASRIVAAATTVPLAEFESHDFHDHLQRSLRQSVHRPWELTQALSQLTSALFGAAVVSVVLVTIEPWIFVALLLAGVPAAWATTRNSRALFDAWQAITPLSRERQYLQEILTGRHEAKEVRAFESGPYLLARYAARYRSELDALRAVTRLRTQRATWAGLGSTLIVFATLIGLLGLTVRGDVSFADAAIGAVAVQQLALRVRGVNSAVGSIQEAALFLDDYAEFLARASTVAEGRPRSLPAKGRGQGLVEVHDLWFTYPGAEQPALRGVDLSIEPGSVVALVGANGSGKTTLAKLLCNLYKPDHGSISWRDAPVDHSGAPRPRVSAIFQDFTRYEFTGRDNIALGDAARIRDEAAIVASARAANADQFLATLPNGYDTVLSPSFEGGTDLSVGQWQRVALARALFRDAPLLVLDEPTAALDPAAERELIDSSTRLFANRAVLVISHRFANVVDADHIYVLDDGQIVEHGSHDELLRLAGRYAELYDLQATPFEQVRS